MPKCGPLAPSQLQQPKVFVKLPHRRMPSEVRARQRRKTLCLELLTLFITIIFLCSCFNTYAACCDLAGKSAKARVDYTCADASSEEVHTFEGMIPDIVESLTSTLDCKGPNLRNLLMLDIQEAETKLDHPYRIVIRLNLGGKYSLEAKEILPESQTISGTFEMLRSRAKRPGQNTNLAKSMNEVLDSISKQVSGNTSELWITLKVTREGDGFRIAANAKSKH